MAMIGKGLSSKAAKDDQPHMSADKQGIQGAGHLLLRGVYSQKTQLYWTMKGLLNHARDRHSERQPELQYR